MEKTYSIKEVSELLNVPIDTVKFWARTGKMKYIQYVPNGKRHIPESELTKRGVRI